MAIDIGTGTNVIKNVGTTASADATKTLQGDFDSFLVLLTTQLKNQDPTSPMETNEFTQQIIGFSQVQQSINTNSNLEKLITMNQQSAVANAVSYVDQFVVAETDTFNFKSNQAAMAYSIPADTASTTISVKNANGDVVATFDGETKKGNYSFAWNGKGSDGNDVPAGSYSIVINSKDGAGTETKVAETAAFTMTGAKAFLGYNLPQTSTKTTITIKDEKGAIVNAYEGERAKGDHKFTWDGKDKNGNVVESGKYTISVAATDATETAIDGVKTSVTEIVTQVDLQGGETTFYFNDIPFTMDKIKSVKGYYAET